MATDERQGRRAHGFGRKIIGLNEEVCVLTRVSKAAQLFQVIGFRPTQPTTRGADREGCSEEDEEVGSGEALPHVRNIRVFLGDMAASITFGFQGLNQRGFAGTARADDSN